MIIRLIVSFTATLIASTAWANDKVIFATNWLARFNEWYSERTEQQIPAVLTQYRVQAMWKPLQYSNSRAKERLGWHPTTSFDEAFDRTMASGV